MFTYPNINPIAFHLGSIKVHWYGIMYLVSFICGWMLLKYKVKKLKIGWHKEQVGDLIFFIAMGVILGGRLGYMLFYDFPNFIHSPWIIVKIWEGGMSFHGGLIGVLLAVLLWAKKNSQSFFLVTDLIAPIVPIGLAAGRIGNFIQGELWGKITTMPWGMVYSHAGLMPRHPSEIYEFFCEGVLLFLILNFFARKPRPKMAVSGLFLIGYGAFRILCEFFRQPDPQYGYFAFGWLTMGQILSVPMVFLGVVLITLAYRHKKHNKTPQST
jgi:phosphatidylglycerol---prolipoprotein diacylglyceryl transferase